MTAKVFNIFDREELVIGDGVSVNPDTCLNELVGELTHVVVIGMDVDGNLVGAASHGIAESVLLLERGKRKLITSLDDEQENTHGS